MKRAKDNPLRGGRIWGKKLGGPHGLLLQVLEWVIDVTTGEETDPRKIERNRESTGTGFHEARRKSRAASAKGAVEEARKLMHHYNNWKGERRGWQRACASVGISVRTGENLVVLLDFWKNHRKLFDHYAPLGRTKIYHLARLPENVLKELSPSRVVTVGERKCRVDKLTDRELIAHLRTVAPVSQRKRRSKLRHHLLKSLEIAGDTRLIGAYSRPQLESAVETTQELFAKLKKAAENAA
jgi:hypothetical protein